MDTLKIYAPGTEVELKHFKNIHVIVERVIISENASIQYQLIVCGAERGGMLVNSFEIEGIRRGTGKKHTLGFHTDSKAKDKEVIIFVDDNDKLVNWKGENGVTVDVQNISQRKDDDGQEPKK